MNKQLIRNIIYSVILICLIIVIILIRTRTPFGRDNTSFTPPSGTEITKIELISGKDRLVLERANENWYVNGKYEARESAVNYITEIVSEMRIKSPVSSELFDKEVTENSIEPVKVFHRNRVVSSFLVYKTGYNIYGNFMKLTPGSKPYILHMPGNEGNIGAVFTLNELYWQPFTIFSFLPSEISSVTLDNVTEASESFTITSEPEGLNLRTSGSPSKSWDTLRVKRYLTYFTHVPFERWALELSPEAAAEITSQDPVYRITVKLEEGKEVDLTLWKMLKTDGSADMDRLWAKTSTRKELFVIRYFDIDPVLKKSGYFFPE